MIKDSELKITNLTARAVPVPATALRVCTSVRFRLLMLVTFESFVRKRLKLIIRQ